MVERASVQPHSERNYPCCALFCYLFERKMKIITTTHVLVLIVLALDELNKSEEMNTF